MTTHRFSVRSNRANLVDWHEWDQGTFDLAVSQDKPVVLFLTAFWCGFCQRMDETTLSHDEVIALLNAYFIPVRVEESQRPDVDLRYNQAGWPTIAFITPQGDHLFSVNYLAPEPFIDLLAKTVRMYTDERATVENSVADVKADAERRSRVAREKVPLSVEIVDEITGIVEGLADHENGGYDDPTQNKFLHAEANDFLLYIHAATGETGYLDHVTQTLEKMRLSPTYDDIDGGFYRYSTKPDWRQPHPEKLLADQASVIQNYLRAYVLTGNENLRTTAESLVDYLLTTLFDGETGTFFGCQDYVRPEAGARGERPVQGQRQLLSIFDEFAYCDANSQVVSALLEAWWVLGRIDARTRAVVALEFLWDNLRDPSGGMFHVYANGAPSVPGILMDSTYMGIALLDAYSVLGDRVYMERATSISADIERNFRNPDGGFWDVSETGPAAMATRMTILTQNAVTASFYIALADLSEDAAYRRQAHWALRDFPNTHRNYNAFAAGFGQALSRLRFPPLFLEIAGAPGAEDVRALARAALDQLRHANLVITFRGSSIGTQASATVRFDGGAVGPITEPDDLTPDVMSMGR